MEDEDFSITPVCLSRHYEVDFPTEAEAEEMAFLLEDGWGILIDVETKGKTLCFRNFEVGIITAEALGMPKQDCAKVVNDDWFKGNARLLSFQEAREKYPNEWNEHVAKRAAAECREREVAMKK